MDEPTTDAQEAETAPRDPSETEVASDNGAEDASQTEEAPLDQENAATGLHKALKVERTTNRRLMERVRDLEAENLALRTADMVKQLDLTKDQLDLVNTFPDFATRERVAREFSRPRYREVRFGGGQVGTISDTGADIGSKQIPVHDTPIMASAFSRRSKKSGQSS